MPPARPHKHLVKPLARVAGLALAAFAAVTGLLWGFQSRLIFLPATGVYEQTPDAVGLDWREVDLATADGEQLAGWFVPAPAARAPVILFLHGNAGDMQNRLGRIRALHDLGAAVLIIDYRGYGTSTGRPSERGLERDSEAAWAWLTATAGYAPDRIIVHGRSLGAALAARLAANHDPALLVLESAFTSLPALAADVYPWLPARRLTAFAFDTAGALARSRCPVLVAHSADDDIVPVHHGRTLAGIRPDDTTYIALDGGHNDRTLIAGTAFHDALHQSVTRLHRTGDDA